MSGTQEQVLISIVLVLTLVNGIMSIIEGSRKAENDTEQNTVLKIVAGIVIGVSLLYMLYYLKNQKQVSKMYLPFVMFALILGIVSLVVAVDTPNQGKRGLIVTIMGIVACVVSPAGLVLTNRPQWSKKIFTNSSD